jgi:predicted N-formylglutamate amidohydrolase
VATGEATKQEAVVDWQRGSSRIVLVCEHASSHIPEELDGLGLSDAHRLSHAVWDPGALAVARVMASRLDATLVSGRISRLVYDCNRPPHAPDAMPERSERIDVPGNRDLDAAARSARISTYYEPFRKTLAEAISACADPVIVTIHSFTPLYHGQPRAVEIGLLYDCDTRLADAMLGIAQEHTQLETRRNEPYGPEHGVTHTLKEHALPGRHMNVMIEVRNDLIASEPEQRRIGDMLAGWVEAALATVEDGAR